MVLDLAKGWPKALHEMSDHCGHLLLVGGGHAHVAVLADWIKHGLPCERATLLTPLRTLRYSGMVPGWIAGQYPRDIGLVDLQALAHAAGAHLVLDRGVSIDPSASSVLTLENGVISFDVASIDVGGVGRAKRSLGEDPRLIDVRPIDGFVDRIDERIGARAVGEGGASLRIAVIGGGAGGVELAFGLRGSRRLGSKPGITLILGKEGLLPGFSRGVANKVHRALEEQGIACLAADARIENGALMAAKRTVEADLIVAALGSDAPGWLQASGLDVDEAGFVSVDRYQRSTSHGHIFSAGDCAARTDTEVPHSGVHAVHTGPMLAANLRAVMEGEAPHKVYRPRPNSLYLIATGDGSAIGSYGRVSFQGRWAGRLKHWIDKRWISKYAQMTKAE